MKEASRKDAKAQKESERTACFFAPWRLCERLYHCPAFLAVE
jgi:hypothetical protein